MKVQVSERRIPIKISNRRVCLDGDFFASDHEYFSQIPGFWNEIDTASAEPKGSGLIYDPETFWKD